jgi:TonB-linked SusC/RagA family outer membrane protein
MKQRVRVFRNWLTGLLACGLLLLLTSPARAQSPARMNGTVLDEKGEPLVGVTVLLNEAGDTSTPSGTATNSIGVFTFDNLRAGTRYNLTVSYVGYVTQKVGNFLVNAGDNNSLMLRLVAESKSLSDVVVIGYGSQSKAKVTGVISEVKGQDLKRYSGSSFGQQLAGRAAGVVVNDASGQPGTDPQIVIRGIGTLTAGRNPLIVVDGFPLTEGSSLNSINPQDIEKIDILKDPSSAAIYGSRAANGVVIITTKKSKADKSTVSLDVYTGVQERSDKVEYVDAYQAAQFFTEARDYGYVSANPTTRSISDDRATRVAQGASLRQLRLNYLQPYLDNRPGLTNTDWQQEVFRRGRLSSYNVAFAGSSEKSSYYLSANYFDQQGIVINNGLKRYSGTLKVDARPSQKFTVGASLNPSYNKQQYFNNDADFSTDPISNLYIMYPFFSPRAADGSLNISEQIRANTPEDGALGENAVAIATRIKNNRTFFRTFGNTYLTYEPLPGLTLKTLLGGDVSTNYYDFYNPSAIGAYRAAAPKPAVATETRQFATNYLTENTANYNHQWGEHSLDLLAGFTYQEESGSNLTLVGSNIADDNLPNVAGASSFAPVPTRYTWALISYLSRAQYSYANRYLFTATMRRDGSSRFGGDRKWGNFPSFTGGWILSNESFFPQNNVLTFAKLRASYGLSGNNQIGNYSAQGLVNPNNYVFGTTPVTGFNATTTSNPNLGWETKASTNFGLNLTLGKKLTVAADYYTSTTKDLLLNVPVPEQSGYTSSIQNIGKIKNSGFELEVGGADIDLGPVKWGFSGNIATNKNEVLALAPGQTQILTGTAGTFRTQVGGPIAELYGYNVTGVYKTQADIDGTPHLPGTLVGDYKVEDLNNDGVIDLNDRKGFGTYNPKFTYGFSSSFTVKNFELSFAFVGIQGRKIFDQELANQEESGEGFGLPNKYYFENRYHPIDNPNGTLAQPNLGNFSSARRQIRSSNIFYKNADYLRLRSLQLAYTLPAAWAGAAHLSAARVYISANNLFTFTDFLGRNPDATNIDNVLQNGFSQANYPIAKSYLVGFNLTF